MASAEPTTDTRLLAPSARITASSHALCPLDFTSRRLTMVPSGASFTSTSALGLPGTSSANTIALAAIVALASTARQSVP